MTSQGWLLRLPLNLGPHWRVQPECSGPRPPQTPEITPDLEKVAFVTRKIFGSFGVKTQSWAVVTEFCN